MKIKFYFLYSYEEDSTIYFTDGAGRRFTIEESHLIKAALRRFEGVEIRLERAKNLCQGCYCVFLMHGKDVPEELATAYQECCEMAIEIWRESGLISS